MTKPTPKAADASTLRQRAAHARDAAGRFIRRLAGEVTDQPQPASIPEGSAADLRADAFRDDEGSLHDAGRGHPKKSGRTVAAGVRGPRREFDMGRHETFGDSIAITKDLLSSTILGRGLVSADLLDLAAACDWAVAHMAWINDTNHPDGEWLDDRVAAEIQRFDAVLTRIADEPSQGIGDVAAKARAVLADWRPTLSRPRPSASDRALLALLQEVGALSPKGQSASDALVQEIAACWREDAAIPEANREDGDPLYERWYARRGVLLDAAEALPATRDSLFAKALAVAWLEYAQLWARGQERADYATDGRLALDIHAAVMGDPAEPTRGQPPTVSLVDRIDFASATLEELQAIHDTASMVGGVAYAASWQGRCHRRGQGGAHNAAGELMHWLGDALCGVETAAVEEARRRIPANPVDRETRLEILALPTIQNGELEGMAEFARALAAHAAPRTKEA